MSEPLVFFFEGEPVGTFQTDAYPSHPDRYLYSPFRGQGHAGFADLLKRGEAAPCTFRLGDTEVSILVVREIFVLARPKSYWFVDIGKMVAPEGALGPGKEFGSSRLHPIDCRAARDAASYEVDD